MSNILVTDEGVCKIGDFGLAVVEPKNDFPRNNTHQTMCGTPNSLAPEVASGKPYTKMVDLWGLGVILLHLLSGKSPFDDGEVKSTVKNILKMNPELDRRLSPNALHLINGLLKKDDRERMTLQEVRNHDFFKEETGSFFDSGIGTTALTDDNSRKFPGLRQPLMMTGISEQENRFRSLGRGKSLTSPSMPDMMAMTSDNQFSKQFVRSNSVDRFVTPLTPPTRDREKVPTKLTEKINTIRLSSTPELEDIVKGTKGMITEDGRVRCLFEVQKRKGRILETVEVSADGEEILVRRDCEYDSSKNSEDFFTFNSLPTNYYQKYQFMWKYVQSLRSRMPKVILYADTCVAKLMENSPVADFEVKFYNKNVTISFKASQNRIKYKLGSNSESRFSYPLSQQDLETTPDLKVFSDLHSECKGHVDYLENKGLSSRFPVTFGEKLILHNEEDTENDPTLFTATTPNHQPIMTSTAISMTSCQTSTTSRANSLNGKSFPFKDGTKVEIYDWKRHHFRYINQYGEIEFASVGDPKMSIEMQDKVRKVIQHVKENSSRSRSQLSSPR